MVCGKIRNPVKENDANYMTGILFCWYSQYIYECMCNYIENYTFWRKFEDVCECHPNDRLFLLFFSLHLFLLVGG